MLIVDTEAAEPVFEPAKYVNPDVPVLITKEFLIEDPAFCSSEPTFVTKQLIPPGEPPLLYE